MISAKANFSRSPANAQLRNGFSIVELLIVIGIIIVLLGIILVAVNAATRTAQRTNTTALMNSMRQGLIQFESEIGYLPPVLDHGRNLMFQNPAWDDGLLGDGPCPQPLLNDASSDQRAAYQDWYSITTLAEYLIGYGPAIEDGRDGLGIRHPGRDGYWGASQFDPSPGTLDGRKAFLISEASARYREGQVYGPYIELQDERLLGAIDPANPWLDEEAGIYDVRFPGESGYNEAHPKVIVDYWGQPIRYYRLPYVGNNPAQAYRQRPHDPDFRQPRLSDFFALRPYRVRDQEVVDGIPDLAGNPTTTLRLQTAQFGMLSAGPNRSMTPTIAVDEIVDDETREFNIDNIVELGP